MKNSGKRILTILLVMAMLMSFSVMAFADNGSDDDEFTVVVSVEGLTLGQGIYCGPKAYTLDEINALIATKGYGPYEQSKLTAGMATLAFLIDNGIDYDMGGTWESGAYLKALKGLDTGKVDIPEVITENGGPDNSDNDGNDDAYLGEFDYSMMAGWMITVNNLMTPVGCADFGFEDYKGYDGYEDYGNTYVVRWQFSLWGYGLDLGIDNGWGFGDPYFNGANKDELYIAYANRCEKAPVNAQVIDVMKNLTASQDEVDNAAALLSSESMHKEVTDKAVAATCTKTGLTEGSHCSLCNEVIKAQETVPALGHKAVTDKAVEATCNKAGLTEGSHCSVCNEVIKAQETVPALGHKWSDWETVVPACVEDGGLKTRECSVCGEVETKDIAQTNDHSNDPFSDISASGYHDYIISAHICGIINGYPDGTFRPNANVTRAQFITMLYNGFGEKTDGKLDFKDASTIADAYKDAVIWGVENEIINGYTDGTFRPNQEISRAQMATFLYRYLKQIGEFEKSDLAPVGYKDAGDIASPYVEAVNAISNLGIMNGTGNNMFSPNGTANRGMSATVMFRTLDCIVSA